MSRSVNRRDSLVFDKKLKELGEQIRIETGLTITDVELTSLIARNIDPEDIVKRINIVLKKRGRPKIGGSIL